MTFGTWSRLTSIRFSLPWNAAIALADVHCPTGTDASHTNVVWSTSRGGAGRSTVDSR